MHRRRRPFSVDSFFALGLGWVAFLICLGIASIVGYVLNIIHIIGMTDFFTGLGIVRIAGIFIPPLGGFMGLFF